MSWRYLAYGPLVFALIAKPTHSASETQNFPLLYQKCQEYKKALKTEAALTCLTEAHRLNAMHFDVQLDLIHAINAKAQNLRDSHGSAAEVEKLFRDNLILAEDLNKKYPDKAESHFALAVVYGNLALFSSAREKVRLSRDIESHLLRAIQLNSKLSYPYIGLGVFYREVSRITFLERFFAELLFGTIPKASLDEAIRYFSMALERDPDFAFTHFHLAKAYEYALRRSDAILEYEKVLALRPSDYGDATLKEMANKALQKLRKKRRR